MSVIICPLRCWACMLLQCPGGPHDWADSEDRAHAVNSGQPDPVGQSCGCWCVEEPARAEGEPDFDFVEVRLTDETCDVCGEVGACSYDSEGRALIHASDDTEGDE